jgi:hypothetical protein
MALICTLLTLTVQHCNSGREADLAQKKLADDTVRRIENRLDLYSVGIQALYYWAKNASPGLKVPPPMEIQLDGGRPKPMSQRLDPSWWDGVAYAAEPPPPCETLEGQQPCPPNP